MSKKMIVKMCTQLKRALNVGLILFIALSFTNGYAQAIDYAELAATEDSKAKSAVKSTLRHLKKIEKGKNPEKYYQKILDSEAKILKRDSNYDFSKLKLVADQALVVALEEKQKEAEQKTAKKELKAAEKARKRAVIDQNTKQLQDQIAFANRLDRLANNDNVNLSLSDDDEDAVKELEGEMNTIRVAAQEFVSDDLGFLAELRKLDTENTTPNSDAPQRSWWSYRSQLDSVVQTYRSRFEQLNQEGSPKITTNIELLELRMIAMNLYVGATLTADDDIISMSRDADQKLSAIPPPAETLLAVQAYWMKKAVFPQALYHDAVLEEKFREAFVATGWGEKIKKIALKEQKWAPAFNDLGFFMGNTMSAWIGAVDSEGRGKIYTFRILNRGDQYPSIRHDHKMIEWILAENIE